MTPTQHILIAITLIACCIISYAIGIHEGRKLEREEINSHKPKPLPRKLSVINGTKREEQTWEWKPKVLGKREAA